MVSIMTSQDILSFRESVTLLKDLTVSVVNFLCSMEYVPTSKVLTKDTYSLLKELDSDLTNFSLKTFMHPSPMDTDSIEFSEEFDTVKKRLWFTCFAFRDELFQFYELKNPNLQTVRNRYLGHIKGLIAVLNQLYTSLRKVHVDHSGSERFIAADFERLKVLLDRADAFHQSVYTKFNPPSKESK